MKLSKVSMLVKTFYFSSRFLFRNVTFVEISKFWVYMVLVPNEVQNRYVMS